MEQNKEIVDSLIVSDNNPKKPSRMFRDLKETDKNCQQLNSAHLYAPQVYPAMYPNYLDDVNMISTRFYDDLMPQNGI